ncbi:MAG: hypothetical protein FJY29_06305 [Betaproteobacteria bacterium]|nr:hypothetical protein [Betaproteobacteria bacterium]
MTKHKFLPRVVLLSLVVLQGAVSLSAFAGSIVINNPPQPQPKKLSIVEDGQTFETELTETDLQVSARVKLWLDSRFGTERAEYPYMVDRLSGTVTILIDREQGRYETVSIQQLSR